MSPIWLNTSALSDSHLLFVSLTFPLILGQDHLNKILFRTLIDSRSTYYFVDSKFVDIHYLKISATLPVAFYLFDSSSNNTISETANLPIIFPTSDCMNLDFFVTLLDSSYSLVFKYNWLAQHILLIDWTNELIKFHLSLWKNLASSYIVANIPLASPSFLDISLQSSDSTVSIPVSETSVLWDALNIKQFLFYFLLFFNFTFLFFCFFFFLKNNEEAHDNEVTWQVTWCDVTSLEHDGKVWKMTSGHMEYT